MTIYFYKADRPHGYLSNFSPHPIEIEAITWPTVEHYYQAQKFVGTQFMELSDRIRRAATPEEAAAIGRNPLYTPSLDWQQRKPKVMYLAVHQKFLTHVDLRELLLATGDQEIIEDSPRDYFWGCGADGTGLNQLGQILMAVRFSCRQALPTSRE
jgi:N-glycosidase YbiA